MNAYLPFLARPTDYRGVLNDAIHNQVGDWAWQRQDVKDELRKNTDLALSRGVFGVPTVFVGERSFWGNDRLEWVESALRRARLERT